MRDIGRELMDKIILFRSENGGLDPDAVIVGSDEMKELLRDYYSRDMLDKDNLYFFGRRIFVKEGHELSVHKINDRINIEKMRA
jgi:hypothetical protein